MIYTLSPLPNPNDDHLGFYVVATVGVLLLLFWFLTACVRDITQYVDGERRRVSVLTRPNNVAFIIPVVVLEVVMIAAARSYAPASIPINERVVATRVGTGSAEEQHRVGKVTQLVTTPYISYQTPDGIVTFKMSPGQVWPDKAVLYKNYQ